MKGKKCKLMALGKYSLTWYEVGTYDSISKAKIVQKSLAPFPRINSKLIMKTTKSYKKLCEDLSNTADRIVRDLFARCAGDEETPYFLKDAPELLFLSDMNGYVGYTPRAIFRNSIVCMDEEPKDWEDLRSNYNARMDVEDLEVEGLLEFADYLVQNKNLYEQMLDAINEMDLIVNTHKSRIEFCDPIEIAYEIYVPEWVKHSSFSYIEDGILIDNNGVDEFIFRDLTFKNKCIVVDAILNAKNE